MKVSSIQRLIYPLISMVYCVNHIKQELHQ